MFFQKPAGGPDSVGGLWPEVVIRKCRSRAGVALLKGAAVQLALDPGIATEIATNDSNSYRPGYSNDTVWNTFVLPVSDANQGCSIQRGGIWGVLLADCADNSVADVQFFGIVEDAFVIKTGTDHAAPGDPLTIAITATNSSFDGVINSNEVVVARYCDAQTNLTNRKLRRIFLDQGLFSQARPNAATMFT